MTRWPGAGAWVVPEGDALVISLGFNGLKCYCDPGEVWDVPEGDAIMTRWPEAFFRVVPEGDALAITLGFNRSRSATAIILGLGSSRRGCIRY